MHHRSGKVTATMTSGKKPARQLGVFVALLVTASAWAGSHPPLPKILTEGTTVYVDDVSWHSSVGEQCSDELKKWGRFRLVSDQKTADLIFHLTGTIEDRTTLEVVDARNQVTLWSSKPDKVRKIISELRKRVEQEGIRSRK